MADDSQPFPLPRLLCHPSSSPPVLITQGAEGRLYKTTYLVPTLPAALKYRPPKPYRHPILDQRLTRQRILAEARILVRCRRDGVPVPAVYALDETSGCLFLEWIDGEPVRVKINAFLALQAASASPDQIDNSPLKSLMRRMGTAVGRLHEVGVVHGDLTTSNMMLRRVSEDAANGSSAPEADPASLLEGEIVIIDFGLANQSFHEEARAVDLYVLERAFASTHPRAQDLFDEVIEGYKQEVKQFKTVLRRLEDVRMRGRKRSMIG